MIKLQIPDDQNLLATIGKISIHHGQLDYVLKMTIKSISNLSIKEALDATDKQGSSDLRKRIRKLAQKKFGEGETLLKLDAFLTRAKKASEKRNELLHSLWAVDLEGKQIIRQNDHSFGDSPKVEEIEKVCEEIKKVTEELNSARLDGFLKDAISQL